MATIGDVARLARVSNGTVSRVLNGADNLLPQTRERVEQAIAELGYLPSAAARSLRSNRSLTLALVLPDIMNAFWPTVARGFEDAAYERGYSVLLCNTDENPAKQQRYLTVLAGQRVDGVVIAPHDSDAANLAILRERRIPVVLLDRRITGWHVDTVRAALYSATHELVAHLIANGHRRIAIISGPQETTSAEDRVWGYRDALLEAGLPIEERLIRRDAFRVASGEKMTAQVLDEKLGVTAILAASNSLAKGALQAISARGLRVPFDIALAALGAAPDISSDFSALTSAVQPAYEMGANAAQLLLSRLEADESLPPREVVLPLRLLVRGSSGPIGGRSPAKGERSMLILPTGPDAPLTASPGEGDRRPVRHPIQRESNALRLLDALHHRPVDQMPVIELATGTPEIWSYVLGRPVRQFPAQSGLASLSPGDHVEFCRRLAFDAVTCHLLCRRGAADGSECGNAAVAGSEQDNRPLIVDQLGQVEAYLRAARNTGMGVLISVPGPAILAATSAAATVPAAANEERWLRSLEELLWIVFDRFGAELAGLLIDDLRSSPHIAAPHQALAPDAWSRLTTPAVQFGRPAILASGLPLDRLTEQLAGAGFCGVYTPETDLARLIAAKSAWGERLALLAGIPPEALGNGTPAAVQGEVHARWKTLGPGCGFVLCSYVTAGAAVPAANYTALAAAAQYQTPAF